MDSINYNNGKLRVGSSLVASVYIVLHGHLNQLFEAAASLSFYITVVFSFIGKR